MNYIAEIKAFYDRLELNPLPSPAIALWHALMSIANKTGWQQEFTAAVSILMLKSGLNAQAIKRARNRLEQDGYIIWRSRGGNQSAIYHINSLVVQNHEKNVPQDVPQGVPQSAVVQNSIKNVPQSEPQIEPQSEPQTVPQSEPQSVPINKHKQKQNKTETKKEIPPVSPILRFEDFLCAYPNKQRRHLAEKAYCDLVSSGTVTEDELVLASENYAAYIRDSGSNKVYLPNNFLEKCVFEDYLGTGQMQAPAKTGADQEPGDGDELVGDDWIDCETPWGR